MEGFLSSVISVDINNKGRTKVIVDISKMIQYNIRNELE
jgi:hypothetical protein